MMRRKRKRRGVGSDGQSQSAAFGRRVVMLERRVEVLEREMAVVRSQRSAQANESSEPGNALETGDNPSPDDPALSMRLRGRVEILTTAFMPGISVALAEAEGDPELGQVLAELAITVVDELGRSIKLPPLQLLFGD